MTDLDIAPLGDEEEKDEWSPRKPQKRGRARSKKDAKIGVGQDAETGQQQDSYGGDAAEEQAGFDIRQDSDTEVRHGEQPETESPGLRQIDLNRVSIRSRSGPPKHRKVQSRDGRRPSATSPARPSLARLDTATDRSSSKVNAGGLPTPTSTSSDHGFEHQGEHADTTETHEGFDTILESEGFTMIDLDLIPSARNFLRPPSEHEHENVEHSQTKPTATQPNLTLQSNSQQPPISSPLPLKQKEPRTSTIPSYLTLAEGESDLSSTVPSSPQIPVLTPVESTAKIQPEQRKITPQPVCSSPKLPSPPKFARVVPSGLRHSRVSTPPKLVKVVNAGIALQGVLSPKSISDSQSKLGEGFQSPRSAAKDRIDGIFEGFDSGTRRELRAGLRLGEELAKRQKSSSPVVDQQPVAQLTKPVAKSNATTQVWRGETTVQHTPVSLPSATEDMAEKRPYPETGIRTTETKRSRHSSEEPSAQLSTPHQQNTPSLYKHNKVEISRSLQKEQEWQLQREAVSKTIQSASADQLIVIDSDSDHEDQSEDSNQAAGSAEAGEEVGNETEGDVWLAEAEAHNSSQNDDSAGQAKLFSSSEQRKQKERAREVISKPRRSLIPSPWKRGEDVDSTFMTNGEMSGMAWQQPGPSKGFAAGVIEREKQGKSSSDTFSPAPIGIQEPPEPQSKELSQDDLDETYGSSEIDLEDEEPPFGDEKRQEDLKAVEEDSVCQLEEEQVEDTEAEIEEDNETSIEASSLPPQPVKIPVNFNDSALSAAAPRSSPPESPRPSTPRSALKGSRNSFGLEDSVKKVVFSPQCHGVDETGNESSLKLKSLSPTPPPSIASEQECARPEAESVPARSVRSQREEPTPGSTPEVQSKSSWLGWLWGSKPSSGTNPQSGPIPTVDGGTDDWQPTTTLSSITSSKPHTSVPSYLLPPSYPSDPTRDVSVPMAVSGEFTNTHFRTLHIIYAKSGRPRFHAPRSVRKGVRELIGVKFECEEEKGGYGFFGWEVDEEAARVVERFMREVEFGWEAKGEAEWGWSEKDIMHNLFRIVVGEEIRREQGMRQQELLQE